MHTHPADKDARLSLWLRVREYAVPPSMIQAATARRLTGDWAAACAAARVDVDLDLRALARTHGSQFASRIRADLRHLAPDLLRWHMPRIAPDGLLRPGLTLTLARYAPAPDTRGGAPADPLHLVVRTPPAWANAGQRISLALWEPDGPTPTSRHPHPHPHPRERFRLDLHRHLWDARRTGELRLRAGADGTTELPPELQALRDHGWAVDRWAEEGHILIAAMDRPADSVVIRLGSRRQLRLHLPTEKHPVGEPPVLPEAAARTLPDLELLRTGLIGPGQLHPLVAAALVPDQPPALAPPAATAPQHPAQPRFVDCRGERHRIGLVDGVLTALDHDRAEARREELLVALTGTPLPCLAAIDEAHRRPECLTGVRERLDHGDTAGALDLVEGLLGPGAVLRSGALLDELEAARQGRISHGLFRAGLSGGRPVARGAATAGAAQPARTGRTRRIELRGRVRNASCPR